MVPEQMRLEKLPTPHITMQVTERTTPGIMATPVLICIGITFVRFKTIDKLQIRPTSPVVLFGHVIVDLRTP